MLIADDTSLFSVVHNKDSSAAALINYLAAGSTTENAYQATPQKHLVIILDNRLSFEEHLRLVFSKINGTAGLLRKLRCLIPRSTLLTICKTFVWPHLDYGDIIYVKVYNSSFHQK